VNLGIATIIAPFEKGTYYSDGSVNSGVIDQNGIYYCSIPLTFGNIYGPGQMYMFNLKYPNDGWKFVGRIQYWVTTYYNNAIFAVGTNGSSTFLAVKFDVTDQSETIIGTFPATYTPLSLSIDDHGTLWGLFISENRTIGATLLGMDNSSGEITTKANFYNGNWIPIDLFWDSLTSTFVSVCIQYGDNSEFFSLCIVSIHKQEVEPIGPTIEAKLIYSGGFFSAANRVIYVQLFFNYGEFPAYLIGFDINSGQILTNCSMPEIGVLMDIALQDEN